MNDKIKIRIRDGKPIDSYILYPSEWQNDHGKLIQLCNYVNGLSKPEGLTKR